MILIQAAVKESPIHGLGLFTLQPLAKGTQIWRLVKPLDIVMAVEEVEALPEHAKQFVSIYGYHDIRQPGFVVIEGDNGRFMNHSFTPNTIFAYADAGYTLRDIEAGEELTCDYGEFALDYNPGDYGQEVQSSVFAKVLS